MKRFSQHEVQSTRVFLPTMKRFSQHEFQSTRVFHPTMKRFSQQECSFRRWNVSVNKSVPSDDETFLSSFVHGFPSNNEMLLSSFVRLVDVNMSVPSDNIDNNVYTNDDL